MAYTQFKCNTWHLFKQKVAAGWLAPTPDTLSLSFLSQLFSPERFAFDFLSWFYIQTKSLHLSTVICCFNTPLGRTVGTPGNKVCPISWLILVNNTNSTDLQIWISISDQGQSAYLGGNSPPPSWPYLPSAGGSLPQEQANTLKCNKTMLTTVVVVKVSLTILWYKIQKCRSQLNGYRAFKEVKNQNLPQDWAWHLLPVARSQIRCGPNKCKIIISSETAISMKLTESLDTKTLLAQLLVDQLLKVFCVLQLSWSLKKGSSDSCLHFGPSRLSPMAGGQMISLWGSLSLPFPLFYWIFILN